MLLWLLFFIVTPTRNPPPRVTSSPRHVVHSVPTHPHVHTTPYDMFIEQAAKETHLDPRLIKAVIVAESQFHVHEISPAGACGLMQLMPHTAQLLAVKDIFDPEENIRAGARHLRYLLNRFSNDLALSLAAY